MENENEKIIELENPIINKNEEQIPKYLHITITKRISIHISDNINKQIKKKLSKRTIGNKNTKSIKISKRT